MLTGPNMNHSTTDLTIPFFLSETFFFPRNVECFSTVITESTEKSQAWTLVTVFLLKGNKEAGNRQTNVSAHSGAGLEHLHCITKPQFGQRPDLHSAIQWLKYLVQHLFS